MIKRYIALSLLFLLIGMYISSIYYNNKINKKEVLNQQKINELLLKTNNENIRNQNIIEKLKENEEKSYAKIKELENTNSNLLADVNDYNIRLYAYARDTSEERVCENKSTNLSNEKAARIELDRRTSSKLIEITKKADKYKTMLEELQDYILQYNLKIDEINVDKNK